MHCSYATTSGHALIGARIYLPHEQITDADRRAALGIPDTVEFRTKPQLAQDILAEAITDDTVPPWATGDEVYGRSPQLRTFLQDNGIGYVMRVGCAFTTEIAPHQRIHAEAAVTTHLTQEQHRERIKPDATTTTPQTKPAVGTTGFERANR
ncbi:transposase [Saccharopolyspora sp. 5N708]|uniref:transposase n=1 Tax=Saccharopolyspora sp. 5N708 TaxID=3457424 RepID=UPI003FD441DF